jgi:hypothetical protein
MSEQIVTSLEDPSINHVYAHKSHVNTDIQPGDELILTNYDSLVF